MLLSCSSSSLSFPTLSSSHSSSSLVMIPKRDIVKIPVVFKEEKEIDAFSSDITIHSQGNPSFAYSCQVHSLSLTHSPTRLLQQSVDPKRNSVTYLQSNSLTAHRKEIYSILAMLHKEPTLSNTSPFETKSHSQSPSN